MHDVAGALSRHIDFPERQIPDLPADPEVKNSLIPELAAQQVRADWGLGVGPIRHVIRELEKHGVAVVFAPNRAMPLMLTLWILASCLSLYFIP